MPGESAGLDSDNPISSFRLIAADNSASRLSDVLVAALDSGGSGVAGSVIGTWIRGSVITWQGGGRAVLNRDVVWSSWFISLKTGRSGVVDLMSTYDPRDPTVTTPAWHQFGSAYGVLRTSDRFTSGGVLLDVSGVRNPAEVQRATVWARVESAVYETSEIVVNAAQHTAVSETSTWLLRRDSRISTGTVIQDSAGAVYSIVGIEPQSRRLGAYMRIRAVRALYSQSRSGRT